MELAMDVNENVILSLLFIILTMARTQRYVRYINSKCYSNCLLNFVIFEGPVYGQWIYIISRLYRLFLVRCVQWTDGSRFSHNDFAIFIWMDRIAKSKISKWNQNSLLVRKKMMDHFHPGPFVCAFFVSFHYIR